MTQVNTTPQTVDCKKTAQNEWQKATFTATLKKGQNNLVITNNKGLPMYIDQIIYIPEGTPEEKYLVTIRETKNGQVTTDKTEVAEGETVTLKVTADNGFQLSELRLVNGVNYTMAKSITVTPDTDEITFVMPDENVTIQPVFSDLSAVYQLDFSKATAGSIPEGWRCVQEDSQIHEYPNSYSSGARLFTGFSGYQGTALYWRNNCAEYGRQKAYPLTLQPGMYTLTYAMAAWKESPKYKVQILEASTGNSLIASGVYTASPNANGNNTASVSSAAPRKLEFTVSQAGNYIISFSDETTTSGYHEFLLLECDLTVHLDPSGITMPTSDKGATGVWSLTGARRSAISRGLNIIRTGDGKTRKIYVK